MNDLFAHTRNEQGEWHLLVDHLTCVANKARKNAEYFGRETSAFWIGLWHDLGKANPAFQDYLKAADQGNSADSVPHAFGGAALLFVLLWRQKQNEMWKDLALPIAGHHAGLHDAGTLALRLDAYADEHQAMLEQLFEFAKRLPTPPEMRPTTLSDHDRELFIRMTFSALVDADYLDTEVHFDAHRTKARAGTPDVEELWRRFDANQTELLVQVSSKTDTNTDLMAVRKEVYEACVLMAKDPPWIFPAHSSHWRRQNPKWSRLCLTARACQLQTATASHRGDSLHQHHRSDRTGVSSYSRPRCSIGTSQPSAYP